jgi:hydroxymethylpyrimidine/phosphomethylpyrimidine kinase
MLALTPRCPTVLTFSGLDPTGGAGLQADIGAIAAAGAHALPVATVLTAQDTVDVRRVIPVRPEDIESQARTVLDDIPVGAFKIGLLGSVEAVRAVHAVILDHPEAPVVLDPVCAAGGGAALAGGATIDAMLELLVPLTSVVTPNLHEIAALAPGFPDLEPAARALISRGCRSVLVTGAHAPDIVVVNRLYTGDAHIRTWEWRRLDGGYHGSGCTLAAALAAALAWGLDDEAAADRAQRYTHDCLRRARRLGRGQLLPVRLSGPPLVGVEP